MTCPELGRCEETLKPNATRPCNVHPCTTWVVGSWGEVSGHRRERAAPLIQGFCTKCKEWWGGNPTLKTKLGATAIKTSQGLMLPAERGVGVVALQGVGMGPPRFPGLTGLPRSRSARLPAAGASSGARSSASTPRRGWPRRTAASVTTSPGPRAPRSATCRTARAPSQVSEWYPTALLPVLKAECFVFSVVTFPKGLRAVFGINAAF